MKRKRRLSAESADDLRQEYRFDYSKARPNPYASQLKGLAVAVVLEPDVAAVFRSSQAVNTALRRVVAAIPRRARKGAPPRRRGGRTSA